MAGLELRLEPLVVTATLQQGVVMDLRHGIAFDGLLVSALRGLAAHQEGLGAPGSLLDGGLGGLNPVEWDLPLGRCAGGLGADWHWLTTTGLPVGPHGDRVSPIPDPHRLLGALDERRAEQVAVALPKNVGGPRGRFRSRATPVLSFPAHAVIWHAIGDASKILELVQDLPAIGSRRGSGEGAVLRWEVRPVSPANPDKFAHLHPDGVLGRPVPHDCAAAVGVPTGRVGLAGLRPPLFHTGRQRVLVLPDPDAHIRKEPHA